MKNKWVWLGIVVAIILIAGALYKFSGSSRDVLNAEGIREDVAVAIKQTFPESERVRAGATQLARSFQLAIDEPEKALETHKIYEAAKACLYAIRGDIHENEETAVGLKVEAMVVNSYQRNRDYIKYNGRLSGQIFRSIQPDFSRCEFDVASMKTEND
jgi:hypothetical protein